jgi:hypothetical protein
MTSTAFSFRVTPIDGFAFSLELIVVESAFRTIAIHDFVLPCSVKVLDNDSFRGATFGRFAIEDGSSRCAIGEG